MKWKKIADDQPPVGFRRNFSRHYILPSGEKKAFDITDVGHTVAVLALTTQDEVVLVRQYRPGPQAMCLELPGGLVDPGESWVEAAGRELREETGYEAGRLEYVSTVYMGAYVQGWKHYFLAPGCKLVGEQKTESDEFIGVELWTMGDFRGLLRDWDSCEVGGAYQALDALGRLG